MARQALVYFAALSALLIIVMYFVGSSTILAVGGHVIQTISYAVTGRDNTGKPSGYAQGATLPTGVLG